MSSPLNRDRSASLEKYFYVPVVRRTFDPRGASVLTSTDVRDPRTNKYYDLGTLWHNTTDQRYYILEAIVGNLGRWVLITGGGGGVITELRADDGNIASPDGLGRIDVNGNVVANATHAQPLFTRANIANTLDLDLQYSSAEASSTPAASGISHFDSAAFTVDAVGFVELIGGGSPTVQIGVDANTAPGTNPVVPNGSGQIDILGVVVAAHSVPIETHSRAVNEFNIEPQITTTVTPTPVNSNDVGMACFNENHFTVDATSGMVSLEGGNPGQLLSVQVFTTSGTWTRPANVTQVVVEVVGGGGAGGGTETGVVDIGSGGGAGGYSKEFIISPGASQSVTVGAGGTGGNGSGANGGSSSFGAFLSANGGTGGASATTSQQGGAGGTASGGDYNITGGAGHFSFKEGSTIHYSGRGGDSHFGFGGDGRLGSVSPQNGSDATNYGAGGGGALGTTRTGGDGADGIVIVWEYS